MSIRYRVGIDKRTGRLLVGWAHCAQSVGVIISTQLGERVMLREFGADLISHIGRNVVPATVIAVYRDAVTAIHQWEPEYRVRRCQLVQLDRIGGLGLATFGDYYPEGRLGNYEFVEAADGSFPLVAGETNGARAA
jgi:phage baseplate assembly protein W